MRSTAPYEPCGGLSRIAIAERAGQSFRTTSPRPVSCVMSTKCFGGRILARNARQAGPDSQIAASTAICSPNWLPAVSPSLKFAPAREQRSGSTPTARLLDSMAVVPGTSRGVAQSHRDPCPSCVVDSQPASCLRRLLYIGELFTTSISFAILRRYIEMRRYPHPSLPRRRHEALFLQVPHRHVRVNAGPRKLTMPANRFQPSARPAFRSRCPLRRARCWSARCCTARPTFSTPTSSRNSIDARKPKHPMVFNVPHS